MLTSKRKQWFCEVCKIYNPLNPKYLNGARYAAGILMCNQCVDKEFDAITSDPTIIGSEAWLMEGAR